MSEIRNRLQHLLDHVHGRLTEGEVAGPMQLLISELHTLCRQSAQDEWLEDLAPACRHHPLHLLLLQDPYTRRAFEKPRGYAGDAEMLDYIYSGVPPAETTALGRDLFQVTAGGANARSVLARRDLLAAQIDAVARRHERSSILSIGCGHLREAPRTRCIQPGWQGTFYALDQDERSLEVVRQEQSDRGVIPVLGPVSALLRGGRQFPPIDLIYAGGLYDYLSQGLAARLTRTLFGLLAPGGRLLLANFMPDNHGRGYMEAFMDWRLICRRESDLQALASDLPSHQIAGQKVYRDSMGNVVFLEVDRSR